MNLYANPPSKQKKGYGIVIIRDGMPDELIWENLCKAEEKITSFLVDLRKFPGETTDELIARLDKQFGKGDKKHVAAWVPKNKI